MAGKIFSNYQRNIPIHALDKRQLKMTYAIVLASAARALKVFMGVRAIGQAPSDPLTPAPAPAPRKPPTCVCNGQSFVVQSCSAQNEICQNAK